MLIKFTEKFPTGYQTNDMNYVLEMVITIIKLIKNKQSNKSGLKCIYVCMLAYKKWRLQISLNSLLKKNYESYFRNGTNTCSKTISKFKKE